MSLHEYLESEKLTRVPFYALIMAAMRQADSTNICLLCGAWPEVWAELEARYHAPGGLIASDRP